MRRYVAKFLKQEKGVTAIEYALLGALIAVAITTGANALGVNLAALFNAVAACMAAPNTGVPCAL